MEITVEPKEINALPSIKTQITTGKFKKLATSIKTQTRLLNTETNQSKIVQNKLGKRRESNQPSFDANAFKSHVCQFSHVSNTARSHLTKPPLMRTRSDLKAITSIVNTLKTFERYPQTVRNQLARALYYECFEDGRVIVRQGDAGYSFYFILSGGVTVEVTDKDEKTGEDMTQVVGEMYAGDMFGEVSLLHNIHRTATIITKGKSEFLRMDKCDFDMILRSSYENENGARIHFLSTLPEFDDFTRKELHQLVANCKFVEYQPNKVLVHGSSKESDEFIYFIRSGECRVVKEMNLVIRTLPLKATPQLILPSQKSYKDFPLTKFDTMKKFFLVMHLLKKGDFYGAGEDWYNTSIITTGKVEIVQVPRKRLGNRKHGMLLSSMREQAIERFRSPESVFRSFEVETKWKEYKRQVVLHAVEKRKSCFKNCTASFDDVPLTIRTAYPNHKEHYEINKLPTIPFKF